MDFEEGILYSLLDRQSQHSSDAEHKVLHRRLEIILFKKKVLYKNRTTAEEPNQRYQSQWKGIISLYELGSTTRLLV